MAVKHQDVIRVQGDETDDTAATQEEQGPWPAAPGDQAQAAAVPSAAKQQGGLPAAGRPPLSGAPPSAVYGYIDAARAALLSPHMQGALQIGVGLFIASLFTFVSALRFPMSCVVVTFFCVAAIQSSMTPHLGNRITAAASTTGAMVLGVVVGGIVVTLAQLAPYGAPATIALCVLGPAALAVLVIPRMTPVPPSVWVMGMATCLGFGTAALSAWRVYDDIRGTWTGVGYIILVVVLACSMAPIVAGLVAPTLASYAAQDTLSMVLRSAGVASSRCSALLFNPAGMQHSSSSKGHAATAAAAADNLEAEAAITVDKLVSAEQWRLRLQANSAPVPPAPGGGASPALRRQPVGALNPHLAQTLNFFLQSAAAEPQWVRSAAVCGGGGGLSETWFDVAAWQQLTMLLQQLVSRLGSLEALLEDGLALSECEAGDAVTPELVARLRLVHSQLATSLARLSDTVRHYGRPGARKASVGGGGAAVGAFCSIAPSFGRTWAEAKADLAACMEQQVLHHWGRVSAAAPGSPVTTMSLAAVRHLGFTWRLTNGLIETVEAVEKQVAVCVCGGVPLHAGPLTVAFGWVLPLLPLLACRDIWATWANVLGHRLPAALKQGWPGVRTLGRSRYVQAGLKYHFVVSTTFICVVVALTLIPQLRFINFSFAFNASALSMSERVEATVYKASFWLVATFVGGALGFLAMLHPLLATSPAALCAILVAFGSVVGLAMPTRMRMTITLSLMTMSAVMVCQCCAGSYFAVPVARVASVLAGIGLAVAVNNLVAPWFMSDASLELLALALKRSTAALLAMTAQHYADMAHAAATYESDTPANPAAAAFLGSGCGTSIKQPPADVAAAAEVASAIATAAADAAKQLGCAPPPAPPVPAPSKQAGLPVTASPPAAAPAGGGTAAWPRITPAMLQQQIGMPLVQVQVALIRDTVAWQRGVLATPPVVPRMLQVLRGLQDRLAALQLTLQPPGISGACTGIYMVHFLVPMRDRSLALFSLLTQLVDATARELAQPCPQHVAAVQELVARLEEHRIESYALMSRLRQQLEQQVLEEQRAALDELRRHEEAGGGGHCRLNQRLALLMGGADDAVSYMSFQFAFVKTLDRLCMAARLSALDLCQARNHLLSCVK